MTRNIKVGRCEALKGLKLVKEVKLVRKAKKSGKESREQREKIGITDSRSADHKRSAHGGSRYRSNQPLNPALLSDIYAVLLRIAAVGAVIFSILLTLEQL